MPTSTAQDERRRGADQPQCHTVLYVEDHPVNVLLMQALVAKRPHTRLVVATNGEDGLRAAIAEQPRLLLLDLRLPDCNGVELLRRLREVGGLEQVPAVAVTAEDTHGLTPGGFVEVWHKPMDLHRTLARLDRLLALPASERRPAPQQGSFAEPNRERAGAHRRATQPQPIPFPATTPV